MVRCFLVGNIMTTLRIASNPLVYTPGLFAYIMQTVAPFHRAKAGELLAACNIPANLITNILRGKYQSRIEGETLVLTVEE